MKYLKVSAVYSGTVDLDPLGKPLTIPCSTICGTGVMSCINGYFQQCTAVQPSPEVFVASFFNCVVFFHGLNLYFILLQLDAMG